MSSPMSTTTYVNHLQNEAHRATAQYPNESDADYALRLCKLKTAAIHQGQKQRNFYMYLLMPLLPITLTILKGYLRAKFTKKIAIILVLCCLVFPTSSLSDYWLMREVTKYFPQITTMQQDKMRVLYEINTKITKQPAGTEKTATPNEPFKTTEQTDIVKADGPFYHVIHSFLAALQKALEVAK